jgi:hypothetical protein
MDGDDVVVAVLDGILRAPLGGAPPQTLVSVKGNSMLAVIGSNVFFNAPNPDRPADPQPPTALFAVPLAGGEAKIALAQAPPDGIWTTDGVSLFFRTTASDIGKWTPFDAAPTALPTSGPGGINSIAVHGDDVYVAMIDITLGNSKNGAIERLRKTGGPANRIVTNIGHPSNLVADDSGLYWVEDPPTGTFGSSHIAHANLDGTGITEVSPHGSTQMAVAGDFLYYEWDTAIGRMPNVGGAEQTFATGQVGSDLLEIVGSNLVWVDHAWKSLSDPTPQSVRTACIDGI